LTIKDERSVDVNVVSKSSHGRARRSDRESQVTALDVHAGRRYVDPQIAASALTENACPLTERELEILRLTRGGAPINDIASAVHLAPGTVRNYLSAAMAKLGVTTRHAAAHQAWEQGWI
jgi:two-component system response regulator DesR